MGAGWRRFKERFNQSTPSWDHSFQPTSNARCSTMLREATEFTQQLRKCERAVRAMAAANGDTVRSRVVSESWSAAGGMPWKFEQSGLQ